MPRRAPRTRSSPRLVALTLLLAGGGLLGGGLLLRGCSSGAVGEPGGPAAPTPIEAKYQAPLPAFVPTGIARIDRIVSLGSESACALGGRSLACTVDGGRSWTPHGPFDSPVLAAAWVEERLVVATLDGGLFSVDEAGEARPFTALGNEFGLSDAASREGEMLLLAHRYDEPSDPFSTLPRVIETRLLRLAANGEVETLASTRGFAGDRVLPQGDEAAIAFASVDRRAWRVADGAFRRIPDDSRFGADFGGLLATVERSAERLPGPGRPARPSSSLWLSRDGGAQWELALEGPGDLLVDFADERLGLVIAKGKRQAWVTRNGGRSFEPLRSLPALDAIADVRWLGEHFLVASRDGDVRFFRPEDSGP